MRGELEGRSEGRVEGAVRGESWKGGQRGGRGKEADGRGRRWTAVEGGGRPEKAVDGRGRRRTAREGGGRPWKAVDGRGRRWRCVSHLERVEARVEVSLELDLDAVEVALVEELLQSIEDTGVRTLA